MNKKFVTLTKDEFEAILPNNFKVVDNSRAKEIIYSIDTKNDKINVRIYSTVDLRTNKTRDIGADAIRIIFWDSVNDRPIGKGKKILRVEGATTIQDRIKNRVAEFMLTAGDQEVVDFNYVKAVLNSKAVNWMEFSQNLLESLNKYGSLTDNQLAYVLGETNPKGKMTFEARAKSKDPDFFQKYLDELEEDSHEKVSSDEKREEGESCQTETERNVDGKEEQGNQKENEKRNGIDSNVSKPRPTPDDRKGLVELVATSNHTDYQYSFKKFNPVQSLVFPHKGENKNMVIAANTSAGKTICAELLMDSVLKNGI